MLRFRRLCLFALLVLPLSAADAPVDFQREVRPILSDACFHCHGPDAGTRMAGLRVDTRDGILQARKNGAAVVPGKPEESLLLRRVNEARPARRMPPPSAHKDLTEQQKQVLARWIAQGAPWKDHWAFTAPARPEPPVAPDAAWSRNAIDRFLLARMQRDKLAPAPKADRRTLIRRVTLDLTGLPPTPAEVDAFLADTRPDAYERLVDRLLASAHYGEHRGRYWLDAARYADTHGLHIDNYREMWPYRDWVIQAFNGNMPFDRFVTEQVAGDLLPSPTLEQRIATGFHRCNVTTNEGGAIEDEVASIYAKDRVDTTSTVFLGLTVGCATCHDHKFDPIAQKDFYAMAAFFRNTVQKPMDGNIADTPPVIVVPAATDRERWMALPRERQTLQARLEATRTAAEPRFRQWLRTPARRTLAQPLPGVGELVSVEAQADQVRYRRQGIARPAPLAATVALGDGPAPGGHALWFADKTGLSLGRVALTADQPFTAAAWVFLPPREASVTVLSQLEWLGKDEKGQEQLRGWTLEVNGRQPEFRLIGDKNKGIRVRGRLDPKLKPGTWVHIAATYDGTRRADGVSVRVNGQEIDGEGAFPTNPPLAGALSATAPLQLGYDGKGKGLLGGALADVRVYPRVLSAEQAVLVSQWAHARSGRTMSAPQLTAAQREALQRQYLTRLDPAYRTAVRRGDVLAAEMLTIRRRGAVTHVQQEQMGVEPVAHLLHRGQYDQPREALQPAVPGVLPPLPNGAPRNRLGLAQWLVSPTNPLLTRVTVNRFWQELFGTGLVKSAEDFGSQGEMPSHPELLDWLAVEFRESNWDVKRFFRLLVTSEAYQQSALATPEKLKADPENRLLARGPRFRMDAEMVRDYALAASGLIVPKVGGPSVKPYQPDGLWETVAMEQSDTRFYKQDHGDKLYRRSLYTFWKRSAPPASMDIFNAPSRENCTVRRERTNTPLQALVTMNDPQFVEAARRLAGEALRVARTDVDQQFAYVATRLLARPLADREREITRRAYQDYLRFYDTQPAEARKLLGVGEAPTDATLPAAPHAALTMVANQLLNLDEVLNK